MAKRRVGQAETSGIAGESQHESWLTRRAVAEQFGVHMMTVTKWEQDGMPIARRGAKGVPSLYDPVAVQGWLDSRDSLEHGESADAPVDLTRERARYFRLQADKVEQDVRLRAAELVEASEVEQRWAAMVGAARERLLSLPATALQRGLVTEQGETELIALVDEALSELAVERPDAIVH